MVSGKDDTVCFSDGYPTGSLKGLCCLVDKECGKSPAGQDTVVTADQCGSNDPCPRKQIFIDLYFQFRGTLPQMIDAAACSFPFRVTVLQEWWSFRSPEDRERWLRLWRKVLC